MQIIKHGSIKKKEKLFICENCGCEFLASETEYECASQMAYIHDGITYLCQCPTCKRTAYIYKN